MIILVAIITIGLLGGDVAQWLGRRTCNPEVPGSSPALTALICFTVATFSNPSPRFINSQLVCLPPVGIFNMLFISLINFIVSSISTKVLNTAD